MTAAIGRPIVKNANHGKIKAINRRIAGPFCCANLRTRATLLTSNSNARVTTQVS
ncbi:hypothetical protein ABIC38_006332 [Variovorax sp. 1126]